MRKTITRAQKQGPIMDVWYGGEPATVYCEHGKTWPEGGYGCIPCIEKALGEARVILGLRLAAERVPSDPEPVPQVPYGGAAP